MVGRIKKAGVSCRTQLMDYIRIAPGLKFSEH